MMVRRTVVAMGVAVAWYAALAGAEVIRVSGADSGAILDAIGRSKAGDAVSIPAGTYAIREAISPKTGTRLEGAGQDQTILRFEGAAPSVLISLSGVEDVEVCQLTLDGAGNPNATQGIQGSNARRLNLHHLTIRNLLKGNGFGPHGLLFSGANPSREGGVTDSVIADCCLDTIGVDASFGGGIRLSWGSSRNRLLRNTIRTTGRGGIFADNGSTDLVIQGNTVTGSGGEGLGIEVWGGCDRAVIEDNRIDHWLSIGGCDYCAARRNAVSDKSGVYKFCGIEAIGSYLIVADNTVDGGAKIGLSISGSQAKNYVYWARNTVRDCNQWGTQFQGESGGANCHYFYRCRFEAMPVGVGPVWYPGDEGYGFRANGNDHDFTFEECAFVNNGKLGLQLIGAGVDRLSFVRCAITGNQGAAISGPTDYTALEWIACTVSGNASDQLPPGKAFAAPPPCAAFEVAAPVKANGPVAFANISAPAPGGPPIIAALWDFDDGAPVFVPRAPDGATPAAAPVTHTYPNAGQHVVTLIIWDVAGRGARAERAINVE